MRDPLKILLIIFMVLVVFDAVLTGYAVGRKNFTEQNPLLEKLINRVGLYNALIIKTLLSLIIFGLLVKYSIVSLNNWKHLNI